MLADANSAISVECAPQGFCYLYPNQQKVVSRGFFPPFAGSLTQQLAHTNHLIDKNLKKAAMEGPWLADSDPRYQRIIELLNATETLSHSTNRRLLSDRSLGQHGICVGGQKYSVIRLILS